MRVTGRSIMYYRSIYVLDKSWRESSGKHRAKSRNDFEIRHVGSGHLRVVACAKLSEDGKHDLLDEVERQRLTVKQTIALTRKMEIQENRSRRKAPLRRTDPRVLRGDCIDVVTQTR